jgi:hypothetical protein
MSASSLVRRVFQARDISLDQAADGSLARMLKADLELGDVALDLFEIGERLQQLAKALVRRNAWRVETGGAFGDQAGVDLVVLGALPVLARVALDLHRLQDEDFQPEPAQMGGNAALIAAGGLDARLANARRQQQLAEALPARMGIFDLPALGPPEDGDIEFGFGCINSGRRDSFHHLRHPALLANLKVPATIRV